MSGCSDDRRRGEQKIRDDDDARDAGDHMRVAGAVRHQHEKRDPGAGAEQHGRADHMQKLQREIQGHRSSRIASATRFSTRIGKIFTKGPSGSAHSQGVISVPATM